VTIDQAWRAYKQVWALAEQTCKVFLVRSIENNYAGAYFGSEDPKNRQIHIRRKTLQLEDLRGFWYPVWVDDRHTIVAEICTLVHEIAHAEQHLIGSPRYWDYRRALTCWVEHDEKGGTFTDWDRGRIYEEESIAECRGRELVQMVIPDALPECDNRIYENLKSYHSILWTGRYPSGAVHKWNRKLYINPLQEPKK
jgi:hypothetical protein